MILQKHAVNNCAVGSESIDFLNGKNKITNSFCKPKVTCRQIILRFGCGYRCRTSTSEVRRKTNEHKHLFKEIIIILRN